MEAVLGSGMGRWGSLSSQMPLRLDAKCPNGHLVFRESKGERSGREKSIPGARVDLI